MPPKECGSLEPGPTYHRKKTINGVEIEIKWDKERNCCELVLLQQKPIELQLQTPRSPMWKYEISSIREQCAEAVFKWAQVIAETKKSVHEVFVGTTIFNNKINRAAEEKEGSAPQ